MVTSFHDVEFLSSSAGFCTTFLKNCGRGESLWTNTCHRTVFGGLQGLAVCKISLLQQGLFLCPLSVTEIMKL